MLNVRWLFLALLLVVAIGQSQEKIPPKEESNSGAKKSSKQQTGTEKAPFVIRVQPTDNDKKEAESRADERKDKKQSDAELVLWTKVLAVLAGLQFVALLLQAGIFGYQSLKLKQTVEAANNQATDMQKSIVEAGRAATATENVAAATKRNTELLEPMLRKQMRAYIAVDTGSGTYQDASNRFAGSPILNNTGLTPARNVSFSVNAAILTIENVAPGDLVIPPMGPMVVNDAGIAPRQQFTLQGIVDRVFPVNEIEGIMSGDKRRLFVWGIVTYDDVFGGHWWTKFCHNHIFYMGSDNTIKVNSYYHYTHNDAT